MTDKGAFERSIGYVIVEYNQASGLPGFGWDDTLLQSLDDAEDELELANKTAALNERRETYAIAEVKVRG